MKKLLIAKLAVVTLSFSGLIACSNGDNPGPDPDPTVYHTLTFTGEHCLMKDSKGRPVTEPVKFEAGQNANFYLAGEDESYLLPTENQVKAYVTGGEEEFKGTWKYNPSDGALSVKMTADVTVKATASQIHHTLKFVSEQCEMHDGAGEVVPTEIDVAHGETVKYTIAIKDTYSQNYYIPDEVDFNISGTDKPFEGEHSYDPVTGRVSVKMTDEVTITAVANEKKGGPYTITFKRADSKVYYEGTEVKQPMPNIQEGTTLNFTFTGKDDIYANPTSENVKVIDESQELYNLYSYNSETGAFSIKVTDNITVALKSECFIPVEAGKYTFYFKLGDESLPMKDYEGVFFAGTITDWAEDPNDPLEFTRVEGTDYFYAITAVDSWDVDYINEYQIAKGYSRNCTDVEESRRGLDWAYKSVECAEYSFGYNPEFVIPTGPEQRISLDTHTFDKNLAKPETPLNNYTLSVEFANPVPNDCKVLIFGNMSGQWINPDSKDKEENAKIIKDGTMIAKEGSNNKVFTHTLESIYPGDYAYYVLVESDLTIKEAEVNWNKIFEAQSGDLCFTVNKSDGDGYTNYLFDSTNCAHYNDPLNRRVVTAFASTGMTHGTVQTDGILYEVGATVTAKIVPDSGCYAPINDTGIVFYADENRNKLVDIDVTYQDTDGVFTFEMPDMDLFIEVYCSYKESCSINAKITNEKYEIPSPVGFGEKVIVTFSNPEEGFHIAEDIDEFFETHFVIGTYKDLDYTCESNVGTLTFEMYSNIIIKGSAPSNSLVL